jgi:hypothetical protein
MRVHRILMILAVLIVSILSILYAIGSADMNMPTKEGATSSLSVVQ